ncbi:helix-hairpin-helix domain-containing protein [Terrimonas sp. NA20]|uniref:Helix-hairpin-helix domain-containing protein n=1 Tax=Terrimonas ginsenosidimutans TaxID=2908004 RepID=A0ABS9KXT5_9BACT|nr:helix-hairpin-helix domain-containing protein [Terrimonas ginsenosidimutans]MCG2617135.1 helix-hairpin-helix domain-containing protein [Terrimonas ginsenosidimutans]
MGSFSRYSFITFFAVLFYLVVSAQEIPVQLQQQLEQLADASGEETEDDAYWQQLERLLNSPLNINQAGEDELRELNVLNEWQIINLLKYRQLLGDLLSVYELQAVPGWDAQLLRRLIPFVTVSKSIPSKHDLLQRFKGGTATLLLRLSQLLEVQQGFKRIDGEKKYAGSRQRIFTRYRYTYKNLLQYGWSGDKDAGENFFAGSQRYGFDFNSLHLFARKMGIIESLAFGDYTVNMGQGLIHWQSLAFKKSGDAIAVKRQSPVLKPYTSAGEYNFLRGIGITLRKRKMELTLFASSRRLSVSKDADSSGVFVSSISTSGYHRTASELSGRNLLDQVTAGGSIRYRTTSLQVGINMTHYKFSLPLRKRDEPYNLFSIKGKQWSNVSIDYAYTYRNMHLFGEIAADHRFNVATLQGGIFSVDPSMDVAFVYRNIAKEYQSLNANAFTENASPVNEKGLYLGITWRPSDGWKIDVFADHYEFPWLKYLTDAPSFGKDLLFRLAYTPTKLTELQISISHSLRLAEAIRMSAIDYLISVPGTHARFYLHHMLSRDFSIRCRIQAVRLQKNGKENGFAMSIDGLFKPAARPYSFSARLQFFETDSYASRLYGFENDVLYSHSIPAVYGRGCRYYLVIQARPLRDLSAGMRWAQTVYFAQTEIGSGPDLIDGSLKTEIKLQFIYSFGGRR